MTAVATNSTDLDVVLAQLDTIGPEYLHGARDAIVERASELKGMAASAGLSQAELRESKRLKDAFEAVRAAQERRAGLSGNGPARLPLGSMTASSWAAVGATKVQGPTLTLTASAGAGGESGRELTNADVVAAIDRVRSQQRTGVASSGGDGQIYVATIRASADAAHTLEVGADGTSKIRALTAAGVPMPFTVNYDLDVIGSVSRPLRDGVPNAVADRGGVQFRRDLDVLRGGPASAGVGTWTLAMDATSPQTNAKAMWTPPNGTVVYAEVAAVTSAVKFGNITQRFDPEIVAANTQATHVAHARHAEGLLLNAMHTQSTVSFLEQARLGAVRDVLVALDKAAAYVRDTRRHEPDVALQVVFPHWLRDLFRADLTRMLHTSNLDQLAAVDATIESFFTRRNIEIIWTLDPRGPQTGPPAVPDQRYSPVTGYTAPPASGVVMGFPDAVEFLVYPRGTFVYLDGGTLDVGVVRDQSLVQTNEYIQFQETFEGIFRKGPEVVRVVAPVSAWGGSASTVATTTAAPTGAWND